MVRVFVIAFYIMLSCNVVHAAGGVVSTGVGSGGSLPTVVTTGTGGSGGTPQLNVPGSADKINSALDGMNGAPTADQAKASVAHQVKPGGEATEMAELPECNLEDKKCGINKCFPETTKKAFIQCLKGECKIDKRECIQDLARRWDNKN